MEFGEALTQSGPRVGAEMLRHAQNGSGTCRHKYAEAYNRPPAPLMRKVATNLGIADTRNRRRCRRKLPWPWRQRASFRVNILAFSDRFRIHLLNVPKHTLRQRRIHDVVLQVLFVDFQHGQVISAFQLEVVGA